MGLGEPPSTSWSCGKESTSEDNKGVNGESSNKLMTDEEDETLRKKGSRGGFNEQGENLKQRNELQK